MSKNPMKPADNPKEEPVFESEEVAAIAAEYAEEEKLDLTTLEGTGENGVITLDDVEKAIASDEESDDQSDEESEEQSDEDTSDEEESEEESKINFASDEAAEFAHEVKDKLDIETVEGTGKDGAITKGDVKKALKVIEDAEAEKAAAEKAEADKKAAEEAAKEEESDEEEEERDLDMNNPEDVAILANEVLDGLISFGIPVRGALNTKPRVQEAWNDLITKANKLKKAIVSHEKQA